MKTLFLLMATSLFLTGSIKAQNYVTKNGKISFFSKTDMEDISAVNNQAVSVLTPKTASIAFSVLVNGFLFKKALMQEHFNENYMESAKYPKASFKGIITDITKVDFTKDGSYNVTVTGDLNIHNVTNKVTVPGTILIKAGKISASTSFKVKLEDYKISVPKIVEGNISKTIEIKVDCNYEAR
ncbi:MAG: YceI family protein [Ferruginibacter sp.]